MYMINKKSTIYDVLLITFFIQICIYFLLFPQDFCFLLYYFCVICHKYVPGDFMIFAFFLCFRFQNFVNVQHTGECKLITSCISPRESQVKNILIFKFKRVELVVSHINSRLGFGCYMSHPCKKLVNRHMFYLRYTKYTSKQTDNSYEGIYKFTIFFPFEVDISLQKY